MNDDNDATVGVFSNEDLLPVPAVLATLMVLFLGTNYVANTGIENDGYVDLLILPVIAAFAAFLGRILNTYGDSVSNSNFRNSLISIFFIVFSVSLIEFGVCSPLQGITFAFMTISSLLLASYQRNE